MEVPSGGAKVKIRINLVIAIALAAVALTFGLQNVHSGTVAGQEPACGDERDVGEVAVLGSVTPAVDEGTVRIAELDVTAEIAAGCFEFRNLELPQDPMLVSFEVNVEGYRPTTWENWILLSSSVSPQFTARLEPGVKPQSTDLCNDLLNTPAEDLSAAQSQHAQLCGELSSTGGAPAGAASGQEQSCGLDRGPGEVAILGSTTPSVDGGTVTIPELGLTSEINTGCFEFRNLELPQNPMLVSFEIDVEGYRPTTWAHYIVVGTETAPNFDPMLEMGEEPRLIDPCPELLTMAPGARSAAQNEHAELCEQLPGGLPIAGGGAATPVNWLLIAGLLAGFGTAGILAVSAHRMGEK